MSLKHISLTGHFVLNIRSWISIYNDAKVFVWEPSSNYSDFYIPVICNDFGIKVIAIPHNLESLVSNRKSGISGLMAPTWLDEELKLLKRCDLVFTISLEEQWLLNLHGIEAVCLKYLPSPMVLKDLERIRAKRAQHKPQGPILMLGTALNPPTREGMAAVIEYFKLNPIDSDLVIAGYGTEELMKDISDLPRNINFRGSLDSESLNNFLINCKAVLIYQKGGTGALTKLREFQIAGIPVIANSNSLRSYQNIKGFYSFDKLESLCKLTSIELEIPEIVPASDLAEMNRHLLLIKESLD